MKTVVITGGSRGIGAAAVEAFCSRGDRVYLLYEKNHAAAAMVAEKTGATGICCDVADSGAVRKAFETIGDLDILICNAGIVHYGLMSMLEEQQWDRLFDMGREFLHLKADTPKVFYIWGHAYEFDIFPERWGQFEEFLQMMSNRADVFYGTNKEVLL